LKLPAATLSPAQPSTPVARESKHKGSQPPTFDSHCIEDLRRIARRRLAKGLFEFMDRGNDDEIAVRDNRAG
jgi:hypothetical protein